MHFSEVGRVLDVEPAAETFVPGMRRPTSPTDEFGDGRLDYEGSGLRLRVHVRRWLRYVGRGMAVKVPRRDLQFTYRSP